MIHVCVTRIHVNLIEVLRQVLMKTTATRRHFQALIIKLHFK